MLGPIAGGVLVASVGGSYAFAFNAVALAASAALAWSVIGSFNEQTGEKLRGGLGAGFRFLWNDRVLRWITAAWVLILAGVGALLVSEFPLAELFGAGSLGYGLLISSWGAGTLIGSVFAARAVRRSTYWSLVVGTVGLSVMLGSVAIAPFLWIVCLTQLIGGFFDTFVNVAEETVRQQRTPDELRSRVYRGRRGDRRGRDVGVDRRRRPADRGRRPARGLRRHGRARPAGRGHHLVGRMGAAHAAARRPGGRCRGAEASGEQGAHAPGGVLEAAEEYARV